MIKIKVSYKYFSLVIFVSVAMFIFVLPLFLGKENSDEKKEDFREFAEKSSSIDNNTPKKENEHIGIWVTYMDLDMSSENNENGEKAFRDKFESIIEKSKMFGVNNIYVHVRPFCDSFYPSKIFPWSHLLTGIQGKDPNFDPLAYMAETSHKNNIKFHAWVNPLRIKLKNLPKELSNDNPYYKKFDSTKYFLESEGSVCLNPGYEEVRELVSEGIKEIVSNYDVDGVHFDDYFYPETTDIKDWAFEEKNSENHDIIKWRKDSVNLLINKVYTDIKNTNPKIEFGISPLGNNEKCILAGVDAESLCKNKILDYICPQIYWSLEYNVMPFEKVANTWKNMVKNKDVKLYAGLALYKIGTEKDDKTWLNDKNIIPKEIDILRNLGYDGIMLYSYGQLDLSKEEISNIRKKLC